MSKKRFTSGLDSIFDAEENTSEELLQEDSPLLVKTKEPKVVRKPKKRSSKNFTSDLDSLFEDALKETLEEKAQKIVKDKSKVSPSRKERTRAVYGLDALIRRTVDTNFDEEHKNNIKKRVTFIFENQKLKKLKKIAKVEKSFLKDIIGRVIEEYIEEYEEKFGPVN